MIKIGADPECEWFRNGQFQPAYEVLHEYSREMYARRMSGGVGTDGASETGEFRPRPATTSSGVFRSLGSLIGKASKLHSDLEMYAGSGSQVSIGGHIHFSGIESTNDLVQALDKFIACPLNLVSNFQRRRERDYGRLSEVRYQPHGWEYRSPCSWISHPWVARGVLRVAQLLAWAKAEGKLSEVAVDWDSLISYAKQQSTPTQAVLDIKCYIKALTRLSQSGLKLEQVEIFAAWGKKPRVTSTETPAEVPDPVVIAVIDGTSDYMVVEIVRRAAENLPSRQNTGEHDGSINVSVIGAGSSRTAHQAVFIPDRWGSDTCSEIENALDGGIGVRTWEDSAIGLSRPLRDNNVDLAVQVLEKIVGILIKNRVQALKESRRARIRNDRAIEVIEKGQ